MGIPKFFRWLSERYPQINQDASTLPDIDNLYLDMNGIIHVCSHSNTLGHLIPHLSSAPHLPEAWAKIFKYVELLVQIAKPKKLLYLSIDGVAPRAKMNNQRERRYKFIYEVEEFTRTERKEKREVVEDWFDSNNISPGTKFMVELNRQIRFFIQWKIQNDDNWKELQVIYSGGDVPGEGEHKILRYMRNNKTTPNTVHCIYGLDADLILLGLITHEPHVIILREEVKLGNVRGLPERDYAGTPPKFQVLYLNLLREYLFIEFSFMEGLDLERFIDDFVVLMLFVGNDFIPRLPTFEIHEGAVDRLFEIYKAKWRDVGYLSDCGFINWQALNSFITEFPSFEHKILNDRINNRGKRHVNPAPIKATDPKLTIKEIFNKSKEESKNGEESEEVEEESNHHFTNRETEQLKQTLSSYLERGIYEVKKFYYREMLHIDIDTTEGSEFLQDMIKKYLEGLQWIMYYYFQGVKNWHWHYPHHYAPMISDFYDIHRLLDLEDSKLIFPPAEPFKPLEQLMGVIPPRSQDMLPEEYKILLREADLQRYFPDVPLIEYDIMCAKIGWESLKIIVPFVPYDLLIERARTLTESKQSEIQNATNKDVLYVYDTREAVRSIQSTIPGLFPDVDSTIREIELDYDEDAVFKPEILPGTADVLPGFPSLSHLKNNPELRAVGINVFQTASQLPSVMLNFDRSPMTIEEAYNSLYRKVVYVNYPLQELGIVIGVSNHEKYFPSIDQNYLDYIGLTADGYLTMVRAKLNDYMSLKQGFSIQPEMGIVVHYLPLKSFTRSSRGHIEPKWENDEAYTPLELIMKERAKGHPRDITSVAPSLEEEFPMHAKVIILRKELFGCIGEIVGYAPDKFNPEGGLRVQVFQKPKNICDEIKKVSNLHYEKYYTLKELAGALKRPLGLIARMLGNLKILAKKKGKTKILQIGLNLKNDKEYMAALGWSRWGGYWNPGSDEWEFSEESKKVLMQYNNTFPSMWSSIEKCWAQGKRKFYLDDVFGYARDPFKESEKVALWIFKHVSFKIPWTSVYSQYLSDPVVENLRMIAKNAPFEPITEVFNTNPGFLFIETKPWTGPYLLKPQDYQLGDRVMNLCSGYHRYVNLGAEGTIISLIDRGHAEVLFDELVLNDPKSYKLIISTRYLLNVTRRIIAGKRDQTDVSSCDDIIQHDDSSFKPLLGKKPIKENRAEEITSQILAKMTKNSPSTNDQTAANLALSLNPMANTFDPVPREAQKSPNFESSEREVHISPDQLFAIYQTAPLSGEINPSVAQFFENSQTNVQSNWVQSQESNPNPKPYGIPIPVEQLFESLQISEVKEQESESVHQSLESAQKETESRESGPEVISKLFQGVGPGQYEAPSGLDFPHP